jgi:hypothetical protein
MRTLFLVDAGLTKYSRFAAVRPRVNTKREHMRKIIVGAQVSIDGVMQARGGPTEDPTKGFKFGGWVMPYFDREFGEEIDRLFSENFDLLLGRKTYEILRRIGRTTTKTLPMAASRNSSGNQEVRGFALGRDRYELAGLGAPARHRRCKACRVKQSWS